MEGRCSNCNHFYQPNKIDGYKRKNRDPLPGNWCPQHCLFCLLQDVISTGFHQPKDFLRMYSTTAFSRYPKVSCLSKKGFHYRRLCFKGKTLNFNGISKILWTVTITKISFCVVQNTYNKFFFHVSNSFKQAFAN